MLTIALIGDHDPSITAHRAIPLALELAARTEGLPVEWSWIPTADLADSISAIDQMAGVWCVPGSPYVSAAGALAAIRHARITQLPFLGTCAGFQHALLEYAESQWRLVMPAHAETAPEAENPVIAPLACSLVEQEGTIEFTPGSKIAAAYGALSATEGYHCRYGLNPMYASRLEEGPLRVSGRDQQGEVRAVELDDHPFFVATLFQPERAALAGRLPPLVHAFVHAAMSSTQTGAGQRSSQS